MLYTINILRTSCCWEGLGLWWQCRSPHLQECGGQRSAKNHTALANQKLRGVPPPWSCEGHVSHPFLPSAFTASPSILIRHQLHRPDSDSDSVGAGCLFISQVVLFTFSFFNGWIHGDILVV